jgi:putative flavoprotein involved in K+ transport
VTAAMTQSEHFDTIVVGGGQAGLTAGYYLKRQRRDFVILDAGQRVGDAWRNRWDSLRLFTPAFFCRLPGMRFPARRWSFPTKDDMADYLEAYAKRFDLPVRTGVAVDSLTATVGRFVLTAGDARFEADNVIVATGAHRVPKVPAFASELDNDIVQLHSSEYRNPAQLRKGDVLVVGVGNSGAEIAYELAASRRCVLAGKSKGQLPVRHGSLASAVLFRLIRFLGHRVIRVDTRIGRKLGPKIAANGAPLIRRREQDLVEVGIERIPRVVGTRDGLPLLEDGRTVDVPNVIWCTGFGDDFGWIDLPGFDEDGQPRHYRGVVEEAPGLYFLGLILQYSATSDVLPNGGRDARYVAKHIAARKADYAPARAFVHSAA